MSTILIQINSFLRLLIQSTPFSILFILSSFTNNFRLTQALQHVLGSVDDHNPRQLEVGGVEDVYAPISLLISGEDGVDPNDSEISIVSPLTNMKIVGQFHVTEFRLTSPSVRN